jgi:hypothetical protein
MKAISTKLKLLWNFTASESEFLDGRALPAHNAVSPTVKALCYQSLTTFFLLL